MKRHDDGIDVDGKSPGFFFYPDDFERDVQMLSLSATGLWARMLCWMYRSPRKGFLSLQGGAQMTLEDICLKSGKRHHEVVKALAEMERIGVFSRDENGCIYNRRMVKDAHITAVRKQAVAARLLGAQRSTDGRFAGQFDPAKDSFDPANEPAKAYQNTVLSSSSSFSSSSSKKEEGSVCVKPVMAAATKTANRPKQPTAYDQNNSLEGTGIPSWTEMLAKLCEYGNDGGPVDKAQAKAIWDRKDPDEKRQIFDKTAERIAAGDFGEARSKPQNYLDNNWERGIGKKVSGASALDMYKKRMEEKANVKS